ncbi:MAG TPA: aminoglycoside phosphotransferase family protein, partial [Candidatus Obscuribacterales bacterium]
FRVDTDTGAYCLKLHRNKIAGRIHVEEQFLQFLQQNGFTLSPKMVAANDGNFHIDVKDEHWWLSLFIESDPCPFWMMPTWRNAVCYRGGAELARLHRVSDALNFDELKRWLLPPPEHVKTLSSQATPSGIESVLPSLRHSLNQLLSDCVVSIERDNRRDDAALLFLLEHSPQLEDILDDALSKIEEVVKERGQLELMAHGDYHPGNLLSGQSDEALEVVGIVDYEHSHLEDPIFDVGYAVVMFCAPWLSSLEDFVSGRKSFKTDFNKGAIGGIDGKLLRSLLEGYLTGLERGLRHGGVLRVKGQTTRALAQRLHMLLGPYMIVSCFLLLTWLLKKYLHYPQRYRACYERAVVHSLNLLFYMAREEHRRRNWLNFVPAASEVV